MTAQLALFPIGAERRGQVHVIPWQPERPAATDHAFLAGWSWDAVDDAFLTWLRSRLDRPIETVATGGRL